MFCPNCGLSNPDNAKFCANCGTTLGAASGTGAPPPPPGQQPPQPYRMAPPAGNNNNLFTGRNVALGCLILVALFFFMSLSCMRGCAGHRYRRTYIQRRY